MSKETTFKLKLGLACMLGMLLQTVCKAGREFRELGFAGLGFRNPGFGVRPLLRGLSIDGLGFAKPWFGRPQSRFRTSAWYPPTKRP